MKKYIIQELNTQSYLLNAHKDTKADNLRHVEEGAKTIQYISLATYFDTKEQAENIADAAIEHDRFKESTFTVIEVFIPKERFTN